MTRFGLQIPNFSLDVDDRELFDAIAAQASAAEASGYESVWLMDHFLQLPPLGGPDQPILEAYTTLGAIAARTERVLLGTLVSGVTYRNPAMLAKMVTTLDVISKGRAVLGIGAAWYDVEHEAYGFEYPRDGERLDRLEEAVQICRAMFREDHASFEGTHYTVRDARNLPRPIEPGGPRIMIAGGGEKRTLRLVAQYGDACNIAGDLETIKHKIEVLHRHCADVGRDPAEVAVTKIASVVLTASDEETTSTRDFLVESAGAETAASFFIGQAAELVDQVAPYVEAGVDELLLNLPIGGAPDAVAAVGEALVPAFASA